MGELAEFRSTLRLSISQIASEFGMARATVAKRIDALGVKPDGRRQGHPIYRMRDMIRVVAPEPEMGSGAGPDFDPAKLPPSERRAWYQSENERLKSEADQGRLIPAVEVESEMATLAKTVVRELEILPDTIERDMRVGPEVVEYLQGKIRALLMNIACAVAEAESDDAIRVSG